MTGRTGPAPIARNDYALALSDAEVARYRRMAESAYQREAAQWTAVGIVEGAVVADVGCGPGAVSILTARLVAPGGQVWAVDHDAQAVGATEALAAQLGLDHVRSLVGDAAATGLAPGVFDVVVMRHVLAHSGGREQEIVEHLATLLRPGGHVYLVDVERQGSRVRPPDADLDDLAERYRRFQAARRNDLSIGLRLGELLAGAGLEVVDHRGWYEIKELPRGSDAVVGGTQRDGGGWICHLGRRRPLGGRVEPVGQPARTSDAVPPAVQAPRGAVRNQPGAESWRSGPRREHPRSRDPETWFTLVLQVGSERDGGRHRAPMCSPAAMSGAPSVSVDAIASSRLASQVVLLIGLRRLRKRNVAGGGGGIVVSEGSRRRRSSSLRLSSPRFMAQVWLAAKAGFSSHANLRSNGFAAWTRQS